MTIAMPNTTTISDAGTNSRMASHSWSWRKRVIAASSDSRSYVVASTRLRNPAPIHTIDAVTWMNRRSSYRVMGPF